MAPPVVSRQEQLDLLRLELAAADGAAAVEAGIGRLRDFCGRLNVGDATFRRVAPPPRKCIRRNGIAIAMAF